MREESHKYSGVAQQYESFSYSRSAKQVRSGQLVLLQLVGAQKGSAGQTVQRARSRSRFIGSDFF